MSGGIVVPGQNTFSSEQRKPDYSTPSLGATNTMTGGILPEFDGNTERQDHTLTGGIGPLRPSGVMHIHAGADHTLTGGLGNSPQAFAPGAPRQIHSLQSLTRVRKFDDFPAPSPARSTQPAVTATQNVSDWHVGDVIEGKYDVTAIAGQGGMGVVYKVHHREWNIDMAVKTPLPALIKDTSAKARFLREAQLWVDLGLHPNLVQCWYVRDLGGMPRVFVDYLAGGSLKDWFVSGRVGPGKWTVIIDLIVQACDGLGYAHDRGVVHRDIKPGNMLMSEDGRLCITDFGLVKLAGVEDIESSCDADSSVALDTESEGLTRTGLSLGTPQYGAPEQWGQARHVDARADIYAMGVTLYELCCGRRPFDESGKGEPPQIIIARHLSVKPADPRTYRSDVPAPLAELALKCLAKNPADRPQTLGDMRRALADAYAFLSGELLPRLVPEVAESRASALNNRAVSMWDLGQPTQAEAAWKEALALDPRHAESIYNSALIEFRSGTLSDFEAELRLREAAKTNRKALLLLGSLQLETCDADAAARSFREALTDPALATDAVAWRSLGHSLLALERYREADDAYAKALALNPGDSAAKRGAEHARTCERSVAGRCLYPNIGFIRTIEKRVGSVRAFAVATDGRSLFSDDTQNTLCRFALPMGELLATYKGATKDILSIAVTPDGKQLLGGGDDTVLHAWSLETGLEIKTFYGKGHIGSIAALAVTRDGTAAATTGSDKSVRIWELANGTQIRTLWGHDETGCAVAFSPSMSCLVSGGNDATIRFWELPSGNAGAVLRNALTPVRALAFSLDGAFLFSAGANGRILKWDCSAVSRGELNPCALAFHGHRSNVNALALHPSGRFLFSGGDDNTVRMWDVETGRCLRTLKGHQGSVNALGVTPDGGTLISGASEHLGQPLRLWKLELDRYTRDAKSSDLYAAALHVCRVESQDSSQTASRQFKQHVNEALAAYESAQYAASYAALKRARKIAGYERDPRALELNARLTQKLPLKNVAAAYLHSEIEGRHATGIRAVAFTAHETRALTLGRNDKFIGAWDLSSGGFVRTLEGHKLTVENFELTSDGSVMVSASSDYSAAIWDVSAGTIKHSLQGHTNEATGIAVSRDNRLAATVSTDGSVKLWDIASARCVKTFEKDDSAEPLYAVKFMPDGRSLIVGGCDGAVVLWSVVLGKCVREFPGHSGAILDIAVFPDKPHFLTAGEDKTLRLWNAENGQCIWSARDGVSRFNAIVLSPDSRFIFSGGLEGPDSQVKVWEATTGRLVHSFCLHTKGIAALALSPDGCTLLTGSEDRFLRVWDIEWELLSNDPLSALTAQFRKPVAPGGPASGFSPVSGFIKKEDAKPLGDFGRSESDDPKKSRPSIFLDKGKK
ncbi:MAG: protein kinase [Planctomycetota bacterium]